MQNKYPKLELTWIGKGEEPKLEPRIFIENSELSYGDPYSENKLIHADNLLALKALEQEYVGQIKCIYIDPPYNTHSAFEHYDDGLEHSLWLSLIGHRLKTLKGLLSEDGSIWISIDDNECHYLKVLCDEIFGRKNFISNVVWQKKYAPKSDSKHLSESHDHILVYAKNIDKVKINRLPKSEKQTGRYKNYDNDPRGPWKPDNVLRNEYREYAYFPVKLPNGEEVHPPLGTSWRYTKEKFSELINDNRIWFGKNGNARPAYKRFISEVSDTIPATTVWLYDEVGHNDEAKKEARKFNDQEVFATPKPERLIERILTLASNPGDWVLDSFLGSGTTASVAHKMNRRWIGVELGEHAVTHCIPRLNQVIDGTDQGGISKAVNWKGGSGFKFYNLAPCLLNQDKFGNYIISKEYNPELLSAAMAKQEGFRYQPDNHIYWKQGRSSEKDYIFTTTQFVTVEMLDKIHNEMQLDESLLITCKAYHTSCENRFDNISIKKIPQMLINRCEWKQDSDYSFNIVNTNTVDTVEEDLMQSEVLVDKPKSKKKKQDAESEQLSFL